jgi:hypothetical protein
LALQQKQEEAFMHNFFTVNTFKGFLFSVLMLLGIAAAQNTNADFNEQDFFNNLKTSYYHLSDTPIKNFVTLVTSMKMEMFASQQWKNAEIFPLQLIWFNPDKVYITQRGVPQLEKDKYKEYQDLIAGLKTQIRGILADLTRFYLVGLYDSIHPDYVLKHNEEAVQINFSTQEAGVITRVKYLLGYNGLLILIQVDYPLQQKRIVIYPKFKTVKNKWLCTGWNVQSYEKGQVVSGYDLKIKNHYINNVWVPGEIVLAVQKADKKGQTFYDEIKFKNYLFNQPLQLSSGTRGGAGKK